MVALDLGGQNLYKQMCQSNLTYPNYYIIKGEIGGKLFFHAGHQHLVAKICPSEWFLEVKRIFKIQMDGRIGFGRSINTEKYMSI